MKKTLIYLLLFPALLGLWGCPGECVGPLYKFQTSLEITPSRDTIRVGDTIWLKSTFSKHLKDEHSGQMVDFRNAKITFPFQFSELNKTDIMSEKMKDARHKFYIHAIDGKTTSNEKTAEQYVEVIDLHDQYRYQLVVIPKAPGVFCIEAAHAGNGEISQKVKKCGMGEVYQDMIVTDRHLYLFDAFNIPPSTSSTDSGLYAFVVIPKK